MILSRNGKPSAAVYKDDRNEIRSPSLTQKKEEPTDEPHHNH